jgi:hypothetical protein
MLCST